MCYGRKQVMGIYIHFLFILFNFLTILSATDKYVTYKVDCSTLRWGQYLCPDPDIINDLVDLKTQELKGCTKERVTTVQCRAADGITCTETGNSTFYKQMPCSWRNGYSFETALLLSIFLGMFGADRFYLGYPALGLMKFCTFGFMLLGQLVDIILIATNVVQPADGSDYISAFYGPPGSIIKSDNYTYKIPIRY